MKKSLAILLTGLLLLITGCQPAAPVCPNPPGYLTDLPASAPVETHPTPASIEINSQPLEVDRIVDGPLCNDSWRGSVYVSCGVQVMAWQETPLFLKDCQLSIEPGTVVYVAHHNNTAYYKGCSCHTGEVVEP